MLRRLGVIVAFCALSAAALVAGASQGAGGLPACTSPPVPQLGAVTINQGVGSYARLARGKETLVRFFLTLPPQVGTTCSGSINVTGATMNATGPNGAYGPITAYQLFGSGAPVPASTPSVDSNADPKFVVPGPRMNSCLVDLSTSATCTDSSFFALNFTATVNYTSTGSSTTTGTATFGPSSGVVERTTNALRILVVPMGDVAQGRAHEFGTNAQTALVNGFNALSRIYPVRFGIGNDIAVGSGGLRYTLDPGLLNLKALPGTYDPAGRFCGTSSNFTGIKGQLDTFLNAYNSNPANATHPADKVLGVVDSAISDGNTSAYNCAEGMAATANASNTSVAATEAWVRAIPDVAATKSQPAQPSMTGALMAMELAHTFAQEKQVAGVNTTFHSLNTQADVTAPDRAYNVSNRSYLSNDHSAMRFVTPWDNTNTDLEPADFAAMLCNLGGSLTGDCTSPSVGGIPAPAANQFMISGTTDGTDTGTNVVESFATGGAGSTAPDPLSDLKIRFTDLTNAVTMIGIPYSTGTSVHDSDVSGHVDNTPAVFGGVFDAPQGISKVELLKAGNVIYTRDAQASAPQVTPDGFAPGDTTSSSLTYATPQILPQPDIYFLADTTGSLGLSLQNVKNNIATTVSNIRNQTTIGNPHFGAGDYKDFASCGTGVTPPCFSGSYAFNNGASIPVASPDDGAPATAAINAWSASGGGDREEGQLFALTQLASPADTNFDPKWRSTSSRIVVWFGDNPGHDPICPAIRGAAAGSPSITAASTASALATAGIRVIAVSVNSDTGAPLFPSLGLDGERISGSAPGDSGAGDYAAACGTTVNSETGQATAIVNATNGSFQAAADADHVTQAIMAGLHNLPATVTPSATCDPGLSISFSPEQKTVTSGSDVSFDHTIIVGAGATAGATLHCTVQFSVNGNLDESSSQQLSVKIRSNQIGFTASAPDAAGAAVLVGHVNYDCGNGEQIPLAVGLKPTSISGNVATFSYTYDPSPICPKINDQELHPATITSVVTNGIQTNATPYTTHVTTAHQPPVAAIYTPFDANVASTSPFPLSGLVTDADDGILTANWSISGPFSPPTVPDGNKVDVSPPPGGWPPGDYTIELTGTDKDGNHPPKTTRHVSVVKYQWNGFNQPVDNPPIVNTGTAGRTYPVKFALASLPSLTTVTDTSVVSAVRYSGAVCGSAPSDVLETVASGSTSIRNDGTQFIYNWATPSTPGCYTLSFTLDDGSTRIALFNLR
jgi:hypothetical protein